MIYGSLTGESIFSFRRCQQNVTFGWLGSKTSEAAAIR